MCGRYNLHSSKLIHRIQTNLDVLHHSACTDACIRMFACKFAQKCRCVMCVEIRFFFHVSKCRVLLLYTSLYCLLSWVAANGNVWVYVYVSMDCCCCWNVLSLSTHACHLISVYANLHMPNVWVKLDVYSGNQNFHTVTKSSLHFAKNFSTTLLFIRFCWLIIVM